MDDSLNRVSNIQRLIYLEHSKDQQNFHLSGTCISPKVISRIRKCMEYFFIRVMSKESYFPPMIEKRKYIFPYEL